MINIIGKSKAVEEVNQLIRKVSQTKANVLIIGDSGTGKELVARKIHELSPLHQKPFVPINCGAIPESLMESEMFGHKRGSFTGAVSEKEGLFQSANGGTLFLDEVGELGLSIQVKLLRAIQERSFRKVGGNEDVHVDVRIISATNRDLKSEVSKGRFREDLYYRLNVILIKTPSLSERNDDIPLLVDHFLDKISKKNNISIPTVSSEVINVLRGYHWPGNIRELENTIERAMTFSQHGEITVENLPDSLRLHSSKKTAQSNHNQSAVVSMKTMEIPFPDFSKGNISLDSIINEVESKFILAALEQANGTKKRAAELLGITFRSIRYRLKKLGIDDSEK